MRLHAPLPIDLLTFFRTGHFDCLKIGQDRETILHNFPDPDDWSARSPMERASIWRYGNVELHFSIGGDGRTHGVSVDGDIISESLRSCIADQLAGFEFPTVPSMSGTIQVNYPLELRPE